MWWSENYSGWERSHCLNGDKKGNVVSWKVSSKYMGMELLKETWSWKHFHSEKHFQFAHWAKRNNSSDIIITKGGGESFIQIAAVISVFRSHTFFETWKSCGFYMQAHTKEEVVRHISTIVIVKSCQECQEWLWQQVFQSIFFVFKNIFSLFEPPNIFLQTYMGNICSVFLHCDTLFPFYQFPNIRKGLMRVQVILQWHPVNPLQERIFHEWKATPIPLKMLYFIENWQQLFTRFRCVNTSDNTCNRSPCKHAATELC